MIENQDNCQHSIYSVYILSRVVDAIYNLCHKAAPHETLGRLIGYRYSWQGVPYCKIVDWVGGDLDSSHTHARFTTKGVRECEFFLDERYPNDTKRPKEIGLFHSHPFNIEPFFSATDHETFLRFPYDQEGNVFILIDPLSGYFKVFIIQTDTQKYLKQIPWICYSPQIKS